MPDTALFKRHADLLDRTASKMGLDLEEEAIAGRLQFDEISEAVIRCTGCANPDACDKWLATKGHNVLPVFCENADLLAHLQRGAR